MKTILIGYGNPDRQDDGAAWHTLLKVAKAIHYPIPESFSTCFLPLNQSVDLVSMLQLTPEIAEAIAGYDRVFFIDAHTGDQSEDLMLTKVEPCFQHSPLTHHFTPQSCMEIVHSIYHKDPEAWLISIKGYLFEFEDKLSEPAVRTVDQAVQWLLSRIDPAALN
jgi:hydrogenase maturation protease